MHYSALQLVKQGLIGHRGWTPKWRSPQPRSRYDVVIVGAGGHGLASAYYLAKNHGITDVLVLDKGWLGGGNTGRNTANVRSNYIHPASIAFFEFSLDLYDGLSRALNYNVMFSRRGMVILYHHRHALEGAARLVNSMRLAGAQARMIGRDEIARRVPALDMSPGARFPVVGGYHQARAGTVRHDAVAWGYARAASGLGVDIVQNCEVTGILTDGAGSACGVRTATGDIAAEKVLLAVAGHATLLPARLGLRLPVASHNLQAFVTEPLKPVLDTVVFSSATGIYMNQSDRGGLVIGGGLDPYPSYAQRGSLATIRQVLGAVVAQFPSLGQVRLLRQWSGTVDVSFDSSPIMGESGVRGLYLSCGWGTGGFKAIPAGGWVLAHHIATGRPHPLAEPFALDRFTRGALIDESAGAGIAH